MPGGSRPWRGQGGRSPFRAESRRRPEPHSREERPGSQEGRAGRENMAAGSSPAWGQVCPGEADVTGQRYRRRGRWEGSKARGWRAGRGAGGLGATGPPGEGKGVSGAGLCLCSSLVPAVLPLPWGLPHGGFLKPRPLSCHPLSPPYGSVLSAQNLEGGIYPLTFLRSGSTLSQKSGEGGIYNPPRPSLTPSATGSRLDYPLCVH